MKMRQITAVGTGLVLLCAASTAAMAQGFFDQLKKAAEDVTKEVVGEVKGAGEDVKGAATGIGDLWSGGGSANGTAAAGGGADFVLVHMAMNMREVESTHTIGTIASSEEICELLNHPVFEAWGTEKWGNDRKDVASLMGFNSTDGRITAAFAKYNEWIQSQTAGIPRTFQELAIVDKRSMQAANAALRGCLDRLHAEKPELLQGINRILLKSANDRNFGPCYTTTSAPTRECFPDQISIKPGPYYDPDMAAMVGVVLREGQALIRKGLDDSYASLNQQDAERVAARKAREEKMAIVTAEVIAEYKENEARKISEKAQNTIDSLVHLHNGYTYIQMVEPEIKRSCTDSQSYVQWLRLTEKKIHQHQPDVAACSLELNGLRLTPQTAMDAMEWKSILADRWAGLTRRPETRDAADDLAKLARTYEGRKSEQEVEAILGGIPVSKKPEVMDLKEAGLCGRVIELVKAVYERDELIIGGRPKAAWCGELKAAQEFTADSVEVDPSHQESLDSKIRYRFDNFDSR